MVLEPVIRAQHSKNSLASVGKKTEKRGRAGVGATLEKKSKKKKIRNPRDLSCFRKCHLSTRACALQQLTLKCVKSWLFASNSVSLFEGFTGLKHE